MDVIDIEIDLLLRGEMDPLLPFREHCDLSDRMLALCCDETAALRMIHAIGRTRSGAHAMALFGALLEYSNHSKVGVQLLLEFFDACTLRCFFGLMVSLLSRVNYLIRRDRTVVENQGVLVELCQSALDMCEQMREDQWREGRVSEVLDLVESIMDGAILPVTLARAEGKILIKRLARSKGQLLGLMRDSQ